MKWQYYILIRLSILFLIGTILGFTIDLDMQLLAIIIVATVLVLIVLYHIEKNKFVQRATFALVSYSLFVLLGIFNVTIHQERNEENHYVNNTKSHKTAILSITKVLKQDKYYNKYYAELVQLDTSKASGKLLFVVNKKAEKLQIGSVVLVKALFQELYKPKNPYGFNYKKYLAKQQIYKQLKAKNYVLLRHKKSLKSYSENWRNTLIARLENSGFGQDEFALFKGLLLGDKTSISSKFRQDYMQAGAMHILAISGLHIGILLYLLQFVLQPLERLKYGNFIKAILVILLLWAYALFTGFSPSVIRAVTMFSFISIGINFKRNTSTLNTLFVALLFLLISNPFYIFDLGFQFSFLAVFGIVTLQPKLVKLIDTNYKIIRYFWSLFSISVAAQLSVLPLSLYYFHQFPALFFVSNLLVIPALSVILGLGIFIVILASFNIIFTPLIRAYNFLLYLMNNFIHWVGSKEQFFFSQIRFDFVMLLLAYLILASLLVTIYSKNKKFRYYFLISIVLFQSYSIYTKNHYLMHNEFVIFHKNKASIIARKNGNQLQLFTSDSAVANSVFIKNYNRVNYTKHTQVKPLKNCYSFKKGKLLIVDSLGIYKTSKKVRTIVLRNSPKINLERLILWHRPKQIIADGTNYKSYLKQWQKTCKKYKIPFWSTYANGFYLVE